MLNAKEKVAGPVVFDVTGLPEGFTVDYGENAAGAAGAKAPAAGAAVAADAGRIAEIPAGESEYVFTITPPKDAKPGTHEFESRLMADPAHDFWDDNPMPLIHTVNASLTVPGEDEPTESPSPKPTDDGSDDDKGKDDDGRGTDDNDGKGKDSESKGKDRDKLPRTGAELATALGAALALIVAGGAAVYAVRRRTQV